jgi:glycosyltransferase involved in cell wall biosynthesis
MVSEHASPLACVGGTDAGGQNVHVAALATALAQRDAEVVVYTRRDDEHLPRRVELVPGVVVEHVDAGPARRIPKDQLHPWMAQFSAELAARWQSDRPDVVHSHFWMSGEAAVGAAAPLGVPVAHTYHALGIVKRRHQGAADTSPAGRDAVEQRLLTSVDMVIATCSDEVRELGALGSTARVTVVPCGVDLTRFWHEGPAEPRPPGGRSRLVVVGRLVERKGVQDVLAALAKLPDAELVIAGGPDRDALDADPDVRRLRAAARALGVADRVDLRGRVARGDLPTLLRSADLVVCAPWYEPFGIVPLEAMACGIPVVATAVGGLLDTVVDGVTGLRAEPRQPDALAAAIRRLLDDPVRRRRMGTAATRRARLYSWQRVAAATLRCYEELVRASALDEVAGGIGGRP